jgi:hypothetical protein
VENLSSVAHQREKKGALGRSIEVHSRANVAFGKMSIMYRQSLLLWTSWKFIWTILLWANYVPEINRTEFANVNYFYYFFFTSSFCGKRFDDMSLLGKTSKVYMRSTVRGFDGTLEDLF